jgi:hypothetical protein
MAGVKRRFVVGWLTLAMIPIMSDTASGTSCVWNVVPSADVPGTGGFLYDVAVVSLSDIWAVGYSSPGQTLVEHWDGSSWTIVDSPNVGSDSNLLYRVSADTPTDVWAVGEYFIGSKSKTLVEHWDGTMWTVIPSRNPGHPRNTLYGVVAVSPSNVWAVGRYDEVRSRVLIEHWNGARWKVVAAPILSEGAELRAIDSIPGTKQLWAAGDAGGPLIERRIHGTWSIVPSDLSAGVLWGIDARASNDVWAVGNDYPDAIAEHWNGSTWAAVSVARPGMNQYFFDVESVSPSSAWAVGDYLSDNGWSLLIEEWTGGSWEQVSAPSPPGSTSTQLNGIDAVAGGSSTLWAVGNVRTGTDDGTLVEQGSC